MMLIEKKNGWWKRNGIKFAAQVLYEYCSPLYRIRSFSLRRGFCYFRCQFIKKCPECMLQLSIPVKSGYIFRILLFLIAFDLSVVFRTIYSLGSPGGPWVFPQWSKSKWQKVTHFRSRTNEQSPPRIILLCLVSLELFFFSVFWCSNRTSLAKVEFSSSVFWCQKQPVWSVSSWSWWLYPSCQTGSPIWTGDLWSARKCLEQMGVWCEHEYYICPVSYTHLTLPTKLEV